MTIPAPAVLSINKNGAGTDGLLVQTRELKNVAKAGFVRGGTDRIVSISDISLHIPQGDLVILAGGKQGSRSLLLKTLAGMQAPSGGDLLLDGVDLYANRKLFAPYIGYVPAGLDLPETLTVQENLRYAARLRLPRGTPKDMRVQRVADLLEGLGLQPVAGSRLSSLSPFQRRLVSVAVELVSAPRLLLIEEAAEGPAAEGLDPVDEVRLTRLFKQMGRQGPTVIQAASASRCAQIADKLIVLAPDGGLAWFGPGDEGLAYFRSLTSRERVPGASFGLEDAQETLVTQTPANGATWAKGFQALPAYATYVEDPLNDRRPDLLLEDRPLSRFRGAAKEKAPPPSVPQVSGFTKFNLLAGRANRQLTRERSGLWMLLAPPLVALLDLVLSSPRMNDSSGGDPSHAPVALGLVVFLVMLVAALLFSGEIVKERAIYQRERRTISLALPYALSKGWLVLLLAVYMGLAWAVVHSFVTGFAASLPLLPAYWITLALAALIGGLTGLVASSLARTRPAAVVLSVALVIPQLLLSGSILPLYLMPGAAQQASAGNPARYAFENLLWLSGYGQYFRSDACWRMPASQRNGLSEADKQACPCQGESLYTTSCSFPGIHKFFDVVIERPMPLKPTPDPALANLPPHPQPSQGQTLEDYAKVVREYTVRVQQHDAEVNNYASSLEDYSTALSDWIGGRSEVIGKAEGVISQAIDQYGHIFQIDPIGNWMVLIGMSFFLLLILIVLQL
jgi:ABC-type multidrug transport system ATPase subunit